MLRILILCSVLSIIQLMEVDGIRVSSRWANGLKRIQNNILKRANPFRMLITASSVTSVYVGGTGIWWRSGGQSAKTADWLVDNDVVWPVLRNCACANPRKFKIDKNIIEAWRLNVS